MASPYGMSDVPVLERERRKNDKIDHGHGLLPIAMDCLHCQENERPSSEELCERLAGLKESREYRESKEQIEREQNGIAELERQMGEMELRERATVQQLRGEIQSKEEQLQKAERQIQKHAEQEGNLRSQIEQLNRQLEEQVQVTAEIQQANHSLQRQVEQLQQQLSQQNQKPSQPPSAVAVEAQVSGRQLQQHHSMKEKQSQASPQEDPLQKPHPPKRKLMLGKWKYGGKVPTTMIRGAAIVYGNVAYFINNVGQTYCSYNKRWSKLTVCPCQYSSLAVIRGFLTAIGGYILSGVSQNKLLSIVDKKWVERFPPMPTKRYGTVAVTTQHHLIVAGGVDGSNLLSTVEVMDIETLVWSTAASLPHPYINASAAICGGHLYMLGGLDKDYHTKSALTCSLTNLLQSSSQTSSHSVWNSISDAPVYRSTCVAVDGELLAVGGQDEQNKNTSTVYKYNPTTDSWDLISNMSTARGFCLVAVLPTNEMMVVGGFSAGQDSMKQVEIVNMHFH